MELLRLDVPIPATQRPSEDAAAGDKVALGPDFLLDDPSQPLDEPPIGPDPWGWPPLETPHI